MRQLRSEVWLLGNEIHIYEEVTAAFGEAGGWIFEMKGAWTAFRLGEKESKNDWFGPVDCMCDTAS